MSEFVFCPRCGAVTKPGVCTNCGYNITREEDISENTENVQESKETYETIYTGPAKKQPEPNKNKSSRGWIVGVIIGVAVVVLTLFLIVVLVIVAFVPLIIKGVYNVAQTPAVVNSPTNNNNVTNLFPDVDPDADPDTDPDTDPDADPDADPDGLPDVYDPDSDEYYYATKIEPLYAGTSKFDYDKFVNDYVPSANEYWDESAEDTFDYYINGSYDSYLKSYVSHDFIERDGFATPYYEYLIDSYIENDKYDVERRIIRYEGECNGLFINAYCAYYALSSDKVDFTEANEALRNQAISELYEYISKKSASNNSSETFNYTLYTDAVITFNNDEVISVGYSTTAYENNDINNFYIHGINVDVRTGKVIDNTAVLNFNDDFSEFFVERSNIQNSYVEAINYSDASDVTDVFKDDNGLILLFTPLGIEVGINYRYHYSYGWVTVTINDFDEYFLNQYSFDTGWGKGYDIYQYEKDNNIYFDPDDYGYDEYYYDL
ncbi:MAG: zinc ribbon domain-containing protein [Lachnospiraceae bacterium]|nr:zinc ribbon domain-containing protein [Lachnospiraceae bacterium]